MAIPEWVYAFIGAWLYFLVNRSRDIQIALKAQRHLKPDESRRINRGLKRSITLECLVFVPVSTTLLLFLTPLVTPTKIQSWLSTQYDSPQARIALYVLLGLISYGFPFAAVRGVVTKVALRIIKAGIEEGQRVIDRHERKPKG
ncbi:MAG TPA: hypothetical protein VHE60_19470 [Pyrinomonadaceae bacterium]|nr:hypothetical protein [Pyrinomonadaceae bacterium]